MSIPLVQDNNKDSINTSIIAIKRNIERINMLLGLSNSEEIDTSKFATKEELQQAVTDLQPVDEVAIDNMHSVSSNAVAESFSYVVGEEIKTGRRFFDGTNWRDVYTKAIKIETSTLTGDYSLPAIPNLDNLISVKGNVRMTNFLFPIPFNDVNSTPNWSAYININPNTKVPYLWVGTSQGNSNPFTVFIIFEYSKTTD